jgi:hypothetical protein
LKIPNFTPPIELIELLVVRFKAEVDLKIPTLAHEKLSNFASKDLERLFQIKKDSPATAHTFASASPEDIAKLNKILDAASSEAERKRIPHAEELFIQIKMRLARVKRKMKKPSVKPALTQDLLKPQGN